jgi:hypothetical protein
MYVNQLHATHNSAEGKSDAKMEKLPNGPDVKSYLRGNLGLGFLCLHIDY